ncbi:MAG: DUF2207 domain-containing protein [Trueperaceae bacterium]|nr:MAG: DUF2207 domain-containing protein [Trueperaceae bacterium]
MFSPYKGDPLRVLRDRYAIRLGLIATALLLCQLPSFTEGQRYEWRDIEQRVQILANGDVIVDDLRTLWTDEDFGEAFICLELTPQQSVILLEGSGAVSPGPPASALTQACSGGTELVVRNTQRVSERRVRFHYRLTGSVDFFSDVVQWYWIVLEQDHPPIKGYSLTVNSPGPMPEPFDAYVHRFTNPEEPTVDLSEQRSILKVSFDQIPSGDGVEIRYLMDPALFSIRGTEAGYLRLLEDEARIAGLEMRQRSLSTLRRHPGWGLFGLIVFLILATGIYRAYQRYGREPNLPQMKYPFEPPSNIPPAAVTALSMQTFQANSMGPAFHATIMDLARRGYGEFASKGNRFEMLLDLERSEAGLEEFERDVLNYLKSAAASHRGDPSHLEFRELRKYSQRFAASFLRHWGTKPRNWIEQRLGGPLISQESRRATMKWAALSILGITLCGIGIALTTDIARVELIIAAAACAALLIASSITLPSWREEIAPEIYGWQGFKRTLTDYTRMKDAPDDFFKLWDRYYCYAAALGVAKRFLQNLKRAAPLAGIDERTLTRQASWLGADRTADLAALSSSIASLSSALSAASASASSGGSSSGGGGGGGGGSSGGR